DLRKLGLAAGMVLVIGMPLVPTAPSVAPDGRLQLAAGELAVGEAVRIARVLPHGVELEHGLENTWPGGDDGAWVLGNIVEIRRGVTSAWTAIGVGGAALGEIANEAFFQRRMELVRRLRVEVEDVRPAWIARPELRAEWTAACRAVTAFRRDV